MAHTYKSKKGLSYKERIAKGRINLKEPKPRKSGVSPLSSTITPDLGTTQVGDRGEMTEIPEHITLEPLVYPGGFTKEDFEPF